MQALDSMGYRAVMTSTFADGQGRERVDARVRMKISSRANFNNQLCRLISSFLKTDFRLEHSGVSIPA
jgi:hypothetical protein